MAFVTSTLNPPSNRVPEGTGGSNAPEGFADRRTSAAGDDVTTNSSSLRNPVGLYVHIPFCEKKCHYCDFLSKPGSNQQMVDYLELLTKHASWHQKAVTLDSVFIGGGTPSALPVDLLQILVEKVVGGFEIYPEAEISFESNPESFTLEKARILRAGGVNRISFGNQSTNPEELKRLGRIHTRERATEAFDCARTAGFENINIDLIYGFPGHETSSWKRSMSDTIRQNPEHISAYCFILEDETHFSNLAATGSLKELDEDDQADLFELTMNTLRDAGYDPYEISNYAHPGFECVHNLKYWRQQEYLGIGLGAVSFIDGSRRSAARSLEEYRRQIHRERHWAWVEEPLERIERLKETIMMGLRTQSGVDLDTMAFSPISITERDQLTDILDPWVDKGLLERNGSAYKLTARGVFLSNEVFTDLV